MQTALRLLYLDIYIKIAVTVTWSSVSVTSQVRTRLHQASASTQSQHCDNACNIALIEINGNK